MVPATGSPDPRSGAAVGVVAGAVGTALGVLEAEAFGTATVVRGRAEDTPRVADGEAGFEAAVLAAAVADGTGTAASGESVLDGVGKLGASVEGVEVGVDGLAEVSDARLIPTTSAAQPATASAAAHDDTIRPIPMWSVCQE